MNTRGRKIEFAEMANPHLRITGRMTAKSTPKSKRALSLDSAKLPRSEMDRKPIRLSNAGELRPSALKIASDYESKKHRPDADLQSAEKMVESDGSLPTENPANQPKSCESKTGRAHPNSRKNRPSVVKIEVALFNSSETEGDVSVTSSPSVTMQAVQELCEKSVQDDNNMKRTRLDLNGSNITPPSEAASPVEPETSRRSLRTNRSRDYKFLAGLCSENHLKRKLLVSEVACRRSLDVNQTKSMGKGVKKARLELGEKSISESKTYCDSVAKDDDARTFENKGAHASNSEAENVSSLVMVKTEVDDDNDTSSMIPSVLTIKMEEVQPLEATEVGGQSSEEYSVKLEDVSDDPALNNSGEELGLSSLTETSSTSTPPNSSGSKETHGRTSSSAESEGVYSEANTKISDIETPPTGGQTLLKCPYKDPKLLCLIEKLNSGAKIPSCLNSSVMEVSTLPEEKVDSKPKDSNETSFNESPTPDDEVASQELEEVDVKPTSLLLAITDDSKDHGNRSFSLNQSMNGLMECKTESCDISRSRINARKSFELTLARAASASSSEGSLTKSPSASGDLYNSNIRLEKERKGRESSAASINFLCNSNVTLGKEGLGREKAKFGSQMKRFALSEAVLKEQKSVFMSQDLDEYLASSPSRRESVQMEPDEPEVDEIDGFTFMAFPSQNSLEKHMRKLNFGVINMALSSSHGLGFKSNSSTSEANAACRRKQEALLKSGKIKPLTAEALSELSLEINVNPGDVLSAEPFADESASCTAKVTRRGIGKMGNEKRQPRKGKIYGRKVTGRFASKANIKYHVKKTSPDSIVQSNLKAKGQASAGLGAPPKRGTSQTGLSDVDWEPVQITMKMAIVALRALYIESAADVPCNQTDCTCSGKKGMQPEYEPNLSNETLPIHQEPNGLSCQKEHCRLGCICDSLKTPLKKTTTTKAHCGRPECMFNCNCERLTRSKALKLSNSDSETSGKEVAELTNGSEPGIKKRKRRGWGIPIEEDLGIWDEPWNAAEGGLSLRKSNRIKERPQLQDFKMLRKMIYDDVYEWENEDQPRPKKRRVQKLPRNNRELKGPKFVPRAGAATGPRTKSSASAALGRARTESAATSVTVKSELPTFEISDDDVKVISPEARKNGRLNVMPCVSGVASNQSEMQKAATNENSGHLAPSSVHESTMESDIDLEEVDETVTSCARTMIYKPKQGFASLVAAQNFPQPKPALHHSRSYSTSQEKFATAANASETKQRFSTAASKPSAARPVKENVPFGNVRAAASGVDIFTRSVILVKKETGRGKPEERKPAVVLNMSYNVPLEHCKESIASKVYGMWTEGQAVVGQSFEYENLLVEFLPKSDKEVQIPPHVRDTINPNDVHEITIRITKKRDNRKSHLPVQKAAVPVKVPVLAESSEISLSGLKNFVSGGVFDSSGLDLSNARRLATSCTLGPFAAAKAAGASTGVAKAVCPSLAPNDGLQAVTEETAKLESGSDVESCKLVSVETNCGGKVPVTSTSHESHTVHWRSTISENGRDESLAAGGTLSENDEARGLCSEVEHPVAMEKIPEPVVPDDSVEIKKQPVAVPDFSQTDLTLTSLQSATSSECEVVSGKISDQEQDLELSLAVSCSESVLESILSGSGTYMDSVARRTVSNPDPLKSGDQLVIANTFKINPQTFDSLPSTNAPVSSASTQPGFQLIGVSTSKNPLMTSFRITPSVVKPMLVTTPINPTGLIVNTSGSLPRLGLTNTNKIHLAPPLSLPVAVSGSSGNALKSTSFLVVPKTMVSSLVKTGSTATSSLLSAQQMVPGGCLLVTNSKVLKIGAPVSTSSSAKGDSSLQNVTVLGKTNSSFVQVKPVNTSAAGQRTMLVSTAATANRPRPAVSSVLKRGTDMRQLATRFAGQSPAKDVIEIKDDSDEEKGGHDEEIDILRAEADGSNEAAILREKLGIRLENFASNIEASTGQPSVTAPMPPPVQAPPKQKRKQMHEEKAEFSTNVEITEGWVRIPVEESKAEPTSSVIPSFPSVPSVHSTESETAAVEEEQNASSQMSRPATVQPNLYVELYKAITPYLKQTDKLKKKKISPLYITRKAMQVIKRITEWQNVLINDLLKERMIYDKLKNRHEKLTAATVGEKETEITCESSDQVSSFEPLLSLSNPPTSERRRVPGPLRRKFRGISRKEESESLTGKPQEASLTGDTAAACDSVATSDAVATGNAVAMGDGVAKGNAVAMDDIDISGNAAAVGDMLVSVADASSSHSTNDRFNESTDAERDTDLVGGRKSSDVSRLIDTGDPSEAIKKASNNHSCGNTSKISVGLLSDSLTLTCALDQTEGLHETSAATDCAEHVQCSDFSGEVMTDSVEEVMQSAATYK